MYTSTASQWPRYSLCRDSDTGYFASRSGVAGVAEEDFTSSEDEAGDDPPGDQVDPPDDETDPPTDTDTEEQLPKSTACKDGKVMTSDDDLLTEADCASKTKRTFTTALGESMPMVFGATTQKQADVRFQGQSKREQISISSPETDSKKVATNGTTPPVADKQPDPMTLPSKDDPCSKLVGTRGQGVEDTQDVVAVEDECAQAIVEGQQLQILMVHMDPHDYHCPPSPYPQGED